MPLVLFLPTDMSLITPIISVRSTSWVAPCWVQGPFTSPFSTSVGYGRLILVTTGIGLTAALPIIQQLRTLGREIFLIWVTRNLEQVSFHLPMLLGCTAALVFCDGDRFPDKLHRMLAMVPNLALYKGRPNLEKICCWIILAQHRIDSNEASASPVRPPSSRGAKVAPAAIDSDAPLVLPADPSEFAAAEPSHVIIPKLSAAERSAWSVLYCGNVAPVRQQLKVVSRAWGFLYSEESFAW